MSKDVFPIAVPNSGHFSNNQMIVKLVLDIGEQLLICGGEVNRVEETITRICSAYGALKTDIFCITSTIIITCIWDNGDIITQTRRVSTVSRNFHKLALLNGLSRKICAKKMAVDEAHLELKKISKTPKISFWIALIGIIFFPASFEMFFGGNLLAGVATLISSISIFLIDRYIYNSKMNNVVYYIVCSFLAGAIATFTVHLGIGQNLDKIMIGVIMIVIPGMNFTTAIEDIMSGDTATGTFKLCESIIITCAIAFGFVFSIYLCGGTELAVDSNKTATELVQVITATIGAFGYSLYLGNRKLNLWVTAICGGITFLIHLVVCNMTSSIFIGSLIASITATALSQVFARVLKAPATVFIYPSIVPLVPGSALYYMVSNWLLGNSNQILEFSQIALETALGLALGIVVVVAVTKVIMAVKDRAKIHN